MEKYKVIDWRLRPPYGSFKKNKVYFNAMNDPDNSMIAEAARKYSMELILKEMEENNVVAGCVPFRFTQEDTQEQEINYLCDNYPGKFYCFAHIDPFNENPAAQIDRLIINGKASGAIIEPGQVFIKHPLQANDGLLYPIFDKCQADGILLTMVFGGLYSAGIGMYQPAALDKVLQDFPKLKLVITHGGWPYAAEMCHIAYERPNLYISPDVYAMTYSPGFQDYVTMANFKLKERIIFGSCYPGKTLADSVQEYLSNGLKPESLPYVLHDNAAKLLGIL